jgi:TPR repeat protein
VAKRAEDTTVTQLGVVDQIVDQVKSAAQKQGKTIGKVPEIPVLPAYQANLQASQNQVRECTGVDSNAARDWMDWQRRAAELRNPDVELTFWHSVLERADGRSLEDLVQDKQVAIAALQDAVARGDPRALMAIGEVLENGLFAEPDPYLAYAYFYAAAQAPYANIDTLPWIDHGIFQLLAVGTNTQQYVQQNLDRTSSGLSASQQLAAQQFGLALYQQCCQGSGE